MSRALEDWAYRRGVQLDFIRPGKPVEDAFIESFHGRLRDDCLNVHQFASIEDAQARIEAWRVDYNQRRPHGSIGHRYGTTSGNDIYPARIAQTMPHALAIQLQRGDIRHL
jgi:transposase InsO family protein